MSVQEPTLETRFSEALALHRKGDLKGAKALYHEILTHFSDHLPVLHNLMHIFRQEKVYENALAIGEKIISKTPNDPQIYNTMGTVYETTGNIEKAYEYYQKAVKVDPKFIKAYNNIGVLFYKKRRYEDAAAVLELALKHAPEDTQTLCNLGAVYNQSKAYEKARDVLQKAIAVDGNTVGAYVNLGNVYNKLGKHMDALACHIRALEFDSKSAANYANLAISYKHLERYEDAIEAFQKAIAIDPDFANAHFDLATTYLLLGEYVEGFKEYEWRFKKEEMLPLLHKHKYIFEKPKFAFDLPTEGKTLLLYSEQGFGDIIQFIRFAEPLKAIFPQLNLKVQCREPLKPLLQTLPFIDEVVSRDEEAGAFDYQYAIMSLPFLFGISKEEIVPDAYIPEQESTISLDLHPVKYNIGLVWGGSVTGESYPDKIFSPEQFKPLFDHIDIDLFSLQVGEDAKSLKECGIDEEQIVDLSPQLTDFQKTASVIRQLDLVITSDTSVAHLAGAMGKDVWILLMKKADWRWGLESEDTPWYKNARLFRQTKQGVWDDVFDRVFKALEEKYYIDILPEKVS